MWSIENSQLVFHHFPDLVDAAKRQQQRQVAATAAVAESNKASQQASGGVQQQKPSGSSSTTSSRGRTEKRPSKKASGKSSRAKSAGAASKKTSSSAAAAAAASPATIGGSMVATSPPPMMATTTTTTMMMEPPEKPPVREYDVLMEAVDHAVHLDWTNAGLLLADKSQMSLLQKEQQNLLYASSGEKLAAGTVMPQSTNQQTVEGEGSSASDSFGLRGWGRRNLVSSRVAWARIRLRENSPRIGDSVTGLPSSSHGLQPTTMPPEMQEAPSSTGTEWESEEKAEEDKVLCLLSEATQIYVKQILQKALACARQRQNLDGIRLWHQQCTAAMKKQKYLKELKAASSSSNNNPPPPGPPPNPPPLSLRLGCDINRQVARTMGNAAMTCKRMEEALERQSKTDVGASTFVVPANKAQQLGPETLASAQSMGELSLLPRLAKGVEEADYEAKRQYEIYGGKHSLEPPFGRVPKRAKLEVVDFQHGMHLDALPGTKRRHRAGPFAMNFFY